MDIFKEMECKIKDLQNEASEVHKNLVSSISQEITKNSKNLIEKAVFDLKSDFETGATLIIKKDNKVSKIDGLKHKKLKEIINIVNNDIPLFLVGESGVGKNVIAEQTAKALDLEFYFTNAILENFNLTGFIDANGNYHSTQFRKAFENGGVFFFDELDGSSPEVILTLNAALANRYFPFPDKKVYAHKDFKIIAAGNTFGLGSDEKYVARQKLDFATLDRFLTMTIDIDKKLCESILHKYCQKFKEKENELQEVYRIWLCLRNVYAQLELNNMGMRSLIRALKLITLDYSISKIKKIEFFKGFDKNLIDNVKKLYNKGCGDNDHWKMNEEVND